MIATLTWWWVSFCDLDKPAGERFIGVAIMSDPTERPSWAPAVEGRNVETFQCEIPAELGDPPEEWADRLIVDRARIEALTRAWHGCDVVAVDLLKLN